MWYWLEPLGVVRKRRIAQPDETEANVNIVFKQEGFFFSVDNDGTSAAVDSPRAHYYLLQIRSFLGVKHVRNWPLEEWRGR